MIAELTRFVESNTVRVVEASPWMGTGIDVDEHLYRPITGSDKSLSSVLIDRQRSVAEYLYDTNPDAKRVINMTRDFVVGDQWTITAVNELVQERIDRFWKDPFNNWPEKLRERVKELGVYGEWCFHVQVNPMNGDIRLGWIDPADIEYVNHMPGNYEVLTEVVLKKKADLKDRTYKVIRFDTDENRVVGLLPGEEEKYVGECFFFAINKPTKATRGRSDLFCVADWIDMRDQFLFNRSERAAFANAWFLDVTLKGYSREQIVEFAKSQKAPNPGSVRYHNEDVTYDTVAPDMHASDASNEERMLRGPILTGSGFPEHWFFGTGDNANRASSYEMSDPPMRMLQARQLTVIGMIAFMVSYQIQTADDRGMLYGVPDEEKFSFTVSAPQVSTRDTKKDAETLQVASTSLLIGEQQRWVSKKSASHVFLMITSKFGMALTYEDEQAQIEEEQKAAKKEELERDFEGAENLPRSGEEDQGDNDDLGEDGEE